MSALLIHNSPKYYGYIYRTYTVVRQCSGCNHVSLMEDAHASCPCRNCGKAFDDSEKRTARWVPRFALSFLLDMFGVKGMGKWEFLEEAKPC